MATGAETVAIGALSLLGAAAQAVVAVRWYEPPSRDGETPAPILEAVIFYVLFGVIFALLGVVLATVAGIARPIGTVATLLLTPVGLALAYAAYGGKLETMEDDAVRFMGAVVGVVAAVYPVLLLAV